MNGLQLLKPSRRQDLFRSDFRQIKEQTGLPYGHTFVASIVDGAEKAIAEKHGLLTDIDPMDYLRIMHEPANSKLRSMLDLKIEDGLFQMGTLGMNEPLKIPYFQLTVDEDYAAIFNPGFAGTIPNAKILIGDGLYTYSQGKSKLEKYNGSKRKIYRIQGARRKALLKTLPGREELIALQKLPADELRVFLKDTNSILKDCYAKDWYKVNPRYLLLDTNTKGAPSVVFELERDGQIRAIELRNTDAESSVMPRVDTHFIAKLNPKDLKKIPRTIVADSSQMSDDQKLSRLINDNANLPDDLLDSVMGLEGAELFFKLGDFASEVQKAILEIRKESPDFTVDSLHIIKLRQDQGERKRIAYKFSLNDKYEIVKLEIAAEQVI